MSRHALGRLAPQRFVGAQAQVDARFAAEPRALAAPVQPRSAYDLRLDLRFGRAFFEAGDDLAVPHRTERADVSAVALDDAAHLVDQAALDMPRTRAAMAVCRAQAACPA